MQYQSHFTVEDLLQNESFLNFYSKKDEADTFEWEEWSEDSPERLALVSEAFATLNKLSLKWSEDEIKTNYLQIIATFGQRHNSTTPQLSRYPWLVAASIVLLLGISAVWWYGNHNTTTIYESLIIKSSIQLVEKVNPNPKPLLVILSDGSSVMLQKNSRLSYPQKFNGDTREVYLEGEALFEVAKNPEKPFFVYANELVTKVLGTSFVVKAYPYQKNVQVLVRTGKVSVYRLQMAKAQKIADNKELDGVVISPNQQIVYERQEAEFKKTIVQQPLELQTQSFEFKNEPVSAILKKIQQTYGIIIIYDETLLSNCPLTASLSDEPLYGKLDLICIAIGADYQVIDGQIIVNSKGCN